MCLSLDGDDFNPYTVTSKGEDVVVDSLLMRTEDGGDSWKRITVPTKTELFHLDFNGNSHGWIVGDGGVILETPAHNERLAEIGLVRGEQVQILKVAPFGDPVILQVLDAPVIVRRADLAGVLVA